MEQGQQMGLLDTIKANLNPSTWLEKLHIYRGRLLEVVVYGGIGFLCGYFLKRYSTFFILIILFMAILIFLQQFNFLQVFINWDKVSSFIGLQPAVPDQTMLGQIWNWIKANGVISISFIVGFLLGLKLS
jgi:uncharacterized membrane protein (Fun14 family)